MAAFDILRENCHAQSIESRYNIAPTPKNTLVDESSLDQLTRVPIVRDLDGRRTMSLAIWPLIPYWAEARVSKYSTANARSETIAKLPSFRGAWHRGQRCLIPATGFYEWQIIEDAAHKQPWHIHHTRDFVMGFAGLWDRAKDARGNWFDSCTIVTTEANELMSEIHNSKHRMPVIIDPEHYERWLAADADDAISLTATYPQEWLMAYPVSTRINNPKFDSSECVDHQRIA